MTFSNTFALLFFFFYTHLFATSQPEQLSSGGWHSCLIKNGFLKCWGGENTGFNFGQSNVPADIQNPAQVSSGLHHTCAIDDHGLRCWGSDNFYGPHYVCKNGNCTAQPHAEPSTVPADMKDANLVSAGYDFTCAANSSGIACWGSNKDRQLEVPANLAFAQPEKMQSGFAHTCILESGQVDCWGWNVVGQVNVPASIKNAKDIAVGSSHSCALVEDKVECWGWDKYGQASPPLGFFAPPKTIAAGIGYTCALLQDDSVDCWGDNRFNQLYSPMNLLNPRSLTAGAEFACVIEDIGVYCWGDNGHGQLDVPKAYQSFF